ncbi:uncharacterized protein LOC109851058 [Asparagus officinalis]|nr:uncharacterized protein LOC109851058 [Asparagus officinalis]
MAITHDDLSLKKLKEAGISSRLALFLVIFSVLCGLTAFILCLTAEGSRSEVTYLLVTTPSSKDYKCYYSAPAGHSSGLRPRWARIPHSCQYPCSPSTAYMLIAVTNPQPPALAAWTTPQDPRATSTNRDLTWQSCFLFLTTWVFFALAEVLLMIGIGVESGHLSNWTSPKPNCHAVRPGVFAVAGVFGLVTVFLGVGLYLTALRSQRLQLQEHGRIPTGPGPYPHVPPTAPVIEERQSQRQPPQHVDKTSTSA